MPGRRSKVRTVLTVTLVTVAAAVDAIAISQFANALPLPFPVALSALLVVVIVKIIVGIRKRSKESTKDSNAPTQYPMIATPPRRDPQLTNFPPTEPIIIISQPKPFIDPPPIYAPSEQRSGNVLQYDPPVPWRPPEPPWNPSWPPFPTPPGQPSFPPSKALPTGNVVDSPIKPQKHRARLKNVAARLTLGALWFSAGSLALFAAYSIYPHLHSAAYPGEQPSAVNVLLALFVIVLVCVALLCGFMALRFLFFPRGAR